MRSEEYVAIEKKDHVVFWAFEFAVGGTITVHWNLTWTANDRAQVAAVQMLVGTAHYGTVTHHLPLQPAANDQFNKRPGLLDFGCMAPCVK